MWLSVKTRGRLAYPPFVGGKIGEDALGIAVLGPQSAQAGQQLAGREESVQRDARVDAMNSQPHGDRVSQIE